MFTIIFTMPNRTNLFAFTSDVCMQVNQLYKLLEKHENDFFYLNMLKNLRLFGGEKNFKGKLITR